MLRFSGFISSSSRRLCISSRFSVGIVSSLKRIIGRQPRDTLPLDSTVMKLESPMVHIELPLKNVEERIKIITEKTLGSSKNLEEVKLNDSYAKYKVLVACNEEFGLLPKSHSIHSCQTAQDLVMYYGALEPKLNTPFHRLEKETLPPNLSVAGHPQSVS